MKGTCLVRSGSWANQALSPFLVLTSPPPLKRSWLTNPRASLFPLTVNPRSSHTNLMATGLVKRCPSAVPQVSVGQQANPRVSWHALAHSLQGCMPFSQHTKPSQFSEEAGPAPTCKGNTQVSHHHSLPLHFHRLLSCDYDLRTPQPSKCHSRLCLDAPRGPLLPPHPLYGMVK